MPTSFIALVILAMLAATFPAPDTAARATCPDVADWDAAAPEAWCGPLVNDTNVTFAWGSDVDENDEARPAYTNRVHNRHPDRALQVYWPAADIFDPALPAEETTGYAIEISNYAGDLADAPIYYGATNGKRHPGRIYQPSGTDTDTATAINTRTTTIETAYTPLDSDIVARVSITLRTTHDPEAERLTYHVDAARFDGTLLLEGAGATFNDDMLANLDRQVREAAGRISRATFASLQPVDAESDLPFDLADAAPLTFVFYGKKPLDLTVTTAAVRERVGRAILLDRFSRVIATTRYSLLLPSR